MRADLILGATADIPYWANWLGVWAIEEQAARQLLRAAERLDLPSHLADYRSDTLAEAGSDDYVIVDDVAIISISGPIMKHRPSFGAGCSSVVTRRLIARALNDATVRGIVLHIDSPGGTVAGTKELADAIAKANATKPVMAYACDCMASAAYWIASQAGRIEANPISLIGSIGTLMVLQDSSAEAQQQGVIVHLVRTGAFKGAGVPGTPIGPEILADVQRLTDQSQEFFRAAVVTGRGMSDEQYAAVADARVHLAAEAQSLGLIDQVASFEEAFDRFTASLAPGGAGSDPSAAAAANREESATMSDVQPATIAQLKSELPASTAEFRERCLEAQMTIDQARAAYCKVLEAKIETLSSAPPKSGVAAVKLRTGRRAEGMPEEEEKTAEDPMVPGEEDEDEEEMGGDPVARWDALLSREVKACHGDRAKATSRLAHRHPQLREAMVAAVNARAGRQRRR